MRAWVQRSSSTSTSTIPWLGMKGVGRNKVLPCYRRIREKPGLGNESSTQGLALVTSYVFGVAFSPHLLPSSNSTSGVNSQKNNTCTNKTLCQITNQLIILITSIGKRKRFLNIFTEVLWTKATEKSFYIAAILYGKKFFVILVWNLRIKQFYLTI